MLTTEKGNHPLSQGSGRKVEYPAYSRCEARKYFLKEKADVIREAAKADVRSECSLVVLCVGSSKRKRIPAFPKKKLRCFAL